MTTSTSPRVGMMTPFELPDWDQATTRAFLDAVAAAGIDHVCCADHVSFLAGLGFDGLVQATALAALHPSLPIYCGLYLLPLRHPVLVARQLADVERLAPGRLIFGVGIGGEDRHEVEVCGVDPATRGVPFERFERYCPYGTADDVAGFLASYMAAGCTEFNLIPQAPDLDQAMAGVAAVRALLAGAGAPRSMRP